MFSNGFNGLIVAVVTIEYGVGQEFHIFGGKGYRKRMIFRYKSKGRELNGYNIVILSEFIDKSSRC